MNWFSCLQLHQHSRVRWNLQSTHCLSQLLHAYKWQTTHVHKTKQLVFLHLGIFQWCLRKWFILWIHALIAWQSTTLDKTGKMWQRCSLKRITSTFWPSWPATGTFISTHSSTRKQVKQNKHMPLLCSSKYFVTPLGPHGVRWLQQNRVTVSETGTHAVTQVCDHTSNPARCQEMQ